MGRAHRHSTHLPPPLLSTIQTMFIDASALPHGHPALHSTALQSHYQCIRVLLEAESTHRPHDPWKRSHQDWASASQVLEQHLRCKSRMKHGHCFMDHEWFLMWTLHWGLSKTNPNQKTLPPPNPLSPPFCHLLPCNHHWFLLHGYKSWTYPSQLLTPSICTPGTLVQE